HRPACPGRSRDAAARCPCPGRSRQDRDPCRCALGGGCAGAHGALRRRARHSADQSVTLAARVAGTFAAIAPPETALIAVSGGPDSLALLDILHLEAATHGRALAVGHVDH